MLYATLLIGALRGVLEWSRQTQAASPGFVLFVMLSTFAFFIWLIYKMNQGRNWARITFLILFLIGIPFSVLPLIQSLLNTPISGILGLLQVVLETVALFMLFGRDARPWFRPAPPHSSAIIN